MRGRLHRTLLVCLWIVCRFDDMFIQVYNVNTMDNIKAFETHSLLKLIYLTLFSDLLQSTQKRNLDLLKSTAKPNSTTELQNQGTFNIYRCALPRDDLEVTIASQLSKKTSYLCYCHNKILLQCLMLCSFYVQIVYALSFTNVMNGLQDES